MQDRGANVDGDVMTGKAYMKREWRRKRLLAASLIFFGALALIISGLGIYGLLAYTVTRRTAEIGIRIALGAERRAVIRMVITGSVMPVAIGIGLGIVGAVISSGWVEDFLFGVTKHHPVGLAAAAVLLVLTAAIAALFPARRAAAIDPMRAMRSE